MSQGAGAPTREDALALDAVDPLGGFRERFTLPKDVLYLDGNSLGALPAHTPERLRRMVEEEWGNGLIRSWNEAGWYDLPRGLGERLAPLVGAASGQVVVCDSTSVNLFKVLTAAMRLRPGRSTLISEVGSFPTDLYMTEGLVPARRRLIGRDGDSLADLLDDDTAVVLLSHVDYRTGRLQDMAAVTEQVHAAGALMVWDLCHSVGALPIELDACGADFAVGCGYKYLNGGPGAPAFLYAAARHHDAARQPLTGWFGHAEPFAMSPDYAPATGIGRFLTGTPPLLSFAGLDAALDVWADVDLERIRAKSLSLTSFFLRLTDALGLPTVTPRTPAERGSQISLRHEGAYAVVQALIARGVIGDFRAPDVMRFGFTPLYVSHADVFDAAEALREVLASGEWRDPRFAQRGAVT
ncbi:kynureninase [Streptacidiphilus fuscans]|uniref:Kynureninase n=1 Tax=Streptacidiphilus fuscans TaxID=2789292 RepID=A0A931BCF1_9ACTN|nr:kynureninase [Streptacidiphilus fuscans]MBF9072225.1 kynureninase [Streptacidiphilus fuscans]MBF9073036.1 kynureninase [Streptacidiphilus fuscans]